MVGDLEYETSGKKNWNGKVTIMVEDGSSLIGGALVQGVWDESGSLTSSSCTTDGSGTCQVSKSTKETSQMTFTVTGIILDGYDYSLGTNHDADGDSDGTTIILEKGGNSGSDDGGSGGGSEPNCNGKSNKPECRTS